MKAVILVPLLIVWLGPVQYANGQTVGVVGLYATMTPDNSNRFVHNQFTSKLRHKLGFTTTDTNINKRPAPPPGPRVIHPPL